MKKTLRTKLRSHLVFALVLGLFPAALPTARAEDDGRMKIINPSDIPQTDSPWSFSARSGFYSSYLYRGLEIYSGASIQPSVGAFYSLGDYGTLGGSMWMHISAENDPRSISFFDEQGNFFETRQRPAFFELDPTISYDYTWDKVTFSAGHIWYTDPGSGGNIKIYQNGEKIFQGETAPDTSEFYAGITLDLPGEPQFTFYEDYRKLEYQYYSLAFRHKFEHAAFGDGFNIVPFVQFGFASNANDDKLIYNSNGLEHINIGVSHTAKLGMFQVKPNLTYCFAQDDTGDGETRRVEDKFVIGFEVAYDFAP